MTHNIPDFAPELGKTYPIEKDGSWPATRHVFDEDSIWAIRAALASRRPLLIRGEPGTGKSQLARAAAEVLGWPFYSCVVNARFEPEDLLYRFDAVARLAEAQVISKLETAGDVRDQLAAINFLLPEILWWAFDYDSAKKLFGAASEHCKTTACCYTETRIPRTPDNGIVVLIDEIDKADSDVPNSLLEALGNSGFQAPHGAGWITRKEGENTYAPLIVITTNEERELPPAFVRRCFVLQMDLPEEEAALKEALHSRALAHYPETKICQSVREQAVDQLVVDRKEAWDKDLPLPGQAELLDVLEALSNLHGASAESQSEMLDFIGKFAFAKNRFDPR